MTTHYAIYPPLGCARLGNSDEFFLGPEVPGCIPPDFDYKDEQGRIKRQAVRFRVYAFDGDNVERELTLDDDDVVSIQWTVYVANTKASWYEYNNAMDLLKIYDRNDAPPPEDWATPIAAKRRNGNTVGQDRDNLNIDPGPQTIGGRKESVGPFGDRFFVNQQSCESPDPFFQNIECPEVELAELHTDEAGRLIFVGGKGHSASVARFNTIQNFSNNDEWYDDMCDGWVRATITIKGEQPIEADPAWVFTGPPDYAPEIVPLITMYDLVQGVAINESWLPIPAKPSFRTDIYPILHRLGQMQWVSSAAAFLYGWGSEFDLLNPALIVKLADPDPAHNEIRQAIFAMLRSPAYDTEDVIIPFKSADDSELTQGKLPQRPFMLGDGIDFPGSPMQWFAIPQPQYTWLEQWAAGNFEGEVGLDVHDVDKLRYRFFAGNGDPAKTIEEISSPKDQVDALTRAALEPVYGGAFHPGVEITWPMRHAELYLAYQDQQFGEFRHSSLFRLAVSEDPIYTDYGPVLTPEIAFHEDERIQDLPPIVGPQAPGNLTRWMGLPWQCDAASCQSVYLPEDFPVPVWWPANLPVHVLPEYHYQALLNQLKNMDLSDEQRLAFFNSREPWVRGVGQVGYHAEGGYTLALTQMIDDWVKVGFVVKKEGPADLSGKVPDEIFVEVDRDQLTG
ncbi:MAG: LodA/GoxA family CTQ-dependent oxidase [Chloroflexota bacterium]